MSTGSLSGLNVVELGDYISAPFAARVLGDLGAEVIKVEGPRGDSSRKQGPFPMDVPNLEASGLYLFLNTGKLGITLDVETPTGRELFLKLLGDADILVEGSGPGKLESLGLDYASLHERFPRLIYTSVTPYGRTGPMKEYAGQDINIQAAGGISIGIGMPDRHPLAIPYSQSDYMGGLAAVLATLIALSSRDASGKGQWVDVGSVQALGSLISFVYFLPNFIYRGVAGTRKGRRGGEAYFPNTIMECKDGFVCLYPLRIEQYFNFLKLIGDPEWQQEERYRNRRAMAEEYPDESEALIAPWFKERTKQEIFQLCMEAKVPCAPVRTIEDVAQDEHLNARGYFVDVEHPTAGKLRHPGSPFRLSETPGNIGGPAPTLGQHNEEILCGRLGVDKARLGRLRMAGVV